MSKKIQLIIGSTRQNRISPTIAAWIAKQATKNENVELEIIDLKEVNLPFFDEPTSPSVAPGVSAAAKAWSASVSRADAFIILTPEYNAGYPATLKNAIDYLRDEWQTRPVTIVSYGFMGGLSSAEQLKQVFTRIGAPQIESGVAIAIGEILDESGSIPETENSLKQYESALSVALDEIVAYMPVADEVLVTA